jgi:predicted MFS family arabinose efflux permease
VSRPLAGPPRGAATSEPVPVRPLILLGAAALASVATMRVADPLVPQVAQEFGVSAGEAAIITTAFALAYGVFQLIYGVLGDRFGKYRLVALATLASALTVSLAGLAGSLAMLGAARLVAGATAAAIVPLSMAFIGDHVPYANRQTVLARFMSGTLLGMIAGQVLGGILGDLLGWRAVFLLLGALFLLVGLMLQLELRSPRVPTPVLAGAISPASLAAGYGGLLRRPWVVIVLVTVFVEGFLFYGAFTFVGAYLRTRFALDYTVIGLLLGCMGIGGLLYTFTVRPLVRSWASAAWRWPAGSCWPWASSSPPPARSPPWPRRQQCSASASTCSTTRFRPMPPRWRPRPAGWPSRPSPTPCSWVRPAACGCAASWSTGRVHPGVSGVRRRPSRHRPRLRPAPPAPPRGLSASHSPQSAG